ncbi:MAG: redoxin family protein [Phycisphaerales bacterium JB039]
MKKTAFVALLAGMAAAASGQSLKVGDDAPKLSVEKFLKGKEVKSLEKGTPYVIEFWATWCGPCIAGIPHLSETQEKYADSGLRVIGVAGFERPQTTEERLAGLSTFMEERGDDMAYTVAYDDDRSMSADWMKPAERNGIPAAFVIDRQGKIAFIGHPMSAEFDEAVAKVSTKSAADDRPFALMVGDKAPELAISEWVKGSPVKKFEKGNVYVVEFWATWCGPCINGMPHVTELQKEYGDKVTIIGVNIWDDPANVEPFMKDRGEDKPSGDELMGYTVAIEAKDDDNDIRNGVMAKEWMRAAGRNGIPSAFIVDREGKIAWHGHPMQMDEPLAKVVAGEWDTAAESKKAEKVAAGQAQAQKLNQEYMQAMRSGDTDAAIKALDQLIEIDAERYAMAKYTTLLQADRYDDAYAFARDMMPHVQDNSMALNQIAWFMVDPEARPEQQDLDLALKAASRAAELTSHKDPAILDTLACVHWDRGEKEKALEIQKKAVEHAQGTQFEEELEGRLEWFKKELGKG